MMLRLQAKVSEQGAAKKQGPIEAGLVPAEFDPVNNVVEIGEIRKQ